MPVRLDIRHPGLTQIVSPDSDLEVIATGFQFLEGPVWHPIGCHLTFSDIPGDTMYHWQPDAGVTIFRAPSHKANGNTYDHQARLLTCEHATSRVVRQEADGRVTVLASHYRDQELNSPNDIVVRRDGSIYFSDPNFGRRPTRYGVPRPQQLTFQAVFRLDAQTGELTPVADDFDQPNGLCFSLDETRLFINDSLRQHIRVFDVRSDGTLTNGCVWAETTGEGVGAPDGMKFDSAGHLYCCGPGGIHIFNQEAHCLGVIQMPEQTANFCWGDNDLCSLYICASTTLYRLRMAAPGRPAAV
jgi:gluconolactonase